VLFFVIFFFLVISIACVVVVVPEGLFFLGAGAGLEVRSEQWLKLTSV